MWGPPALLPQGALTDRDQACGGPSSPLPHLGTP